MDIFSSKKLEKILPKIKVILEERIYPLEKNYLNLPFNEVADELEKIREIVKKKDCGTLI